MILKLKIGDTIPFKLGVPESSRLRLHPWNLSLVRTSAGKLLERHRNNNITQGLPENLFGVLEPKTLCWAIG